MGLQSRQVFDSMVADYIDSSNKHRDQTAGAAKYVDCTSAEG